MANTNVNIGIGFSVDKSGLNEMQSLFQRIANQAETAGTGLDNGLKKAGQTAQILDGILVKTFNTELGTLNVTKFNQELKNSGLTLQGIKNDLSQAGSMGAQAYNRLSQAILGTNLQLKQSNKLLDSMATSMANTVKWGITSAIFNNITNSIRKAVDYSKKLNTSLNDIRIVTGKSADEMERFAKVANEGAKKLGSSTLDYTKASLIYYQQGLDDSEAQARAETTLKAANVTGQSGEEVSEQLTAVWNGYKVTAEETEAYVDKLSAVAATTASDLEELSKGMSKVASAANSMGVDVDQLNAQLATIISVTRQAPESVGTALKTIYARLGDLKADGSDEFGVTLGEVSSQLASMGVQVLDEKNDLRDMGDVIEEVAKKWENWTEAQRQAVAVAMAGKRQYNNLIALFDNWGMYTSSLETSKNALGTLQKQQDIYMESTAAHLQKMNTAWQSLFDNMVNSNEMNGLYDSVTNIVEVLDNFVASFGGGIKTLMGFGAIVASIFNKQIAQGINNAIARQQVYQQNLDILKAKADAIKNGSATSLTGDTAYDQAVKANTDAQIEQAKKLYNLRGALTTEQYNTLTGYQQEIGLLEQQKVLMDDGISKLVKQTELIEEEKEQLLGTVDQAEKLKTQYELIAQETKDLIKNQQDISQQTQSVVDKAIKENQLGDSIIKIKSQILKLGNSITKESQQEIMIELQQVKTVKDLEKVKEKLIATINKEKDSNEAQSKIYDKHLAQIEKIVEEKRKQVDLTYKSKSLKTEIDETTKLAVKNYTLTGSIIGATSAFGSMAMALSTTTSLFQTWNNQDLSFGDRLLQTITALSMALPMYISSLKKVNEVWNTSKAVFAQKILMNEQEIASTIESIQVEAAKEASTLSVSEAKQASIAVAAKKIAAEVAEGKVTDAETQSEIVNRIARQEGIDTTNAQQMAILENTAAKTGNIFATNALSRAMGALAGKIKAVSLAMLTNPITWIMAIVAVWTILDQQHKQYIKDLEETAKKSQETANAAKKEAEEHNKVFIEFSKLREEYEKGLKTKEDLFDISNKLIEAYSLEGHYVDLLTGNYEALASAAKEAAKREKIDFESKNNVAIKDAAQAVRESATPGTIHFKEDYHRTLEGLSTQDRARVEAKREELFGKDIESFTIDDTNARTLIESVDKIQEFYEVLRNTPIEKGNRTLDEVKDTYEEFTSKDGWSTLTSATDDRLQGILNFSGLDFASTEEEFNEGIDNLRKDLEIAIEEGVIALDPSKIDSKIAEYVKNINTALGEKFLTDIDIKDKFGKLDKEIFELIDNTDLKTKQKMVTIDVSLKGMSKEQVQDYIDDAQVLVDNDVQDTVAIPASFQVQLNESILKGKDISNDDWKSILSKNPNAEEILGTREDFNNKSTGERVALMERLMQITRETNVEAIKNYEITKQSAEDTKKLIEADISSYSDEAKETDLVVKELEDKLKVQKEIAELQEEEGKTEEAEKTKAKAAETQKDLDKHKEKLDELNEKIKNLNNQKVQIDVQLDMEQTYDNVLQSGIGNVITQLDQMISATEAIGDGWRVAAENVSTFAAAFPDLMDDIDWLEDGSIQLNKDIVNNTLKGNQDIIESNKKVILSSIDDKIKQLEAEKKFQKEKIRILEEVLDGTLEESEAERQLGKATSDYKSQLVDLELVEDSEAVNQMIDNGIIGAKGIIESLDKVNEALGILHENYANVALKDEEILPLPGGVDSSQIKKSEAKSVSKDKGKPELDEETKAYVQSQLDQAKARASEIDKQIASYYGLRSEVLAKDSKADKAIGRVLSGKSGKDDDSKDKEKKKNDDEFDRYWDIKKAIDAVDRALNKLSKDQENLFGYELADSLMETNKLLEQQADNYRALAEAQKQEAAELQGVLSGMGVAFDASGAITNYAAATAAALAEYNEAIAKYNAGLIDESSFKVYEKQYELFKKQLERYEQLFYTEMKDTQEKLEEIERQKKANNLKAWEAKLQVKLDLKELKREWNNFLAEINKDFKSVYKDLRAEIANMKKNAKTYGGKNGTINNELKAIEQVEREIDKMRNGGTSNMFESISQAQEKLKELNEKLLNDAQAFHDLVVQAWQAYLEGIDQVTDQLDEVIDRYGKIKDQLDFLKELNELVYGPKNFKVMNEYYDRAIDNNNKMIDSIVDMRDTLQKELNKLLAEHGHTMEDWEKWSKDEKKLYEEIVKLQEDLNSAILEGAQLLKDQFNSALDEAFDKYEHMLYGEDFSLEGWKEEWEQVNNLADKYLDTTTAIYEKATLNNKFAKSLNDYSGSIKAQEKLLELQQDINDELAKKDELTQYDIDKANLRYELMLKEIALEDAQNNKTSMKVTRNEEGNWSYQYVADEDDILDKQQQVLDLKQQLYELAEEYKTSIQESIANLDEYYMSQMAHIEELEMNGEITHAEAEDRKAKLNDYYATERAKSVQQLAEVSEDMEIAALAVAVEAASQSADVYDALSESQRNAVDLFIEHAQTSYEDITDVIKGQAEEQGDITEELAQEMKDAAREVYEETDQYSSDTLNVIQNNAGLIDTAVSNLMNDITQATENYQDGLEELQNAADMNFANIQDYMRDTEDETDNLNDKAKDLADDGVDYIEDLRKAAEDLEDAWNKVKDAIEDAIRKLEEYLQLRGQAGSGGGDGVPSAPTGSAPNNSGNNSNDSGNNSNDNGGKNPSEDDGKPALDWQYKEQQYKHYTKDKNGDYYFVGNVSGKVATDYVKRGGFISGKRVYYKSGGYTGSWSGADTEENGKLAMLHQKELVLNADDTENLLNAVGIVRALGNFIAATTAGLGNLSAPGVMSSISNNSSSSTYGDVVINASFPNANDVNAIKEAILNLPNMAAQYFSQNRK